MKKTAKTKQAIELHHRRALGEALTPEENIIVETFLSQCEAEEKVRMAPAFARYEAEQKAYEEEEAVRAALLEREEALLRRLQAMWHEVQTEQNAIRQAWEQTRNRHNTTGIAA
jgi:hypothetical protein